MMLELTQNEMMDIDGGAIPFLAIAAWSAAGLVAAGVGVAVGYAIG